MVVVIPQGESFISWLSHFLWLGDLGASKAIGPAVGGKEERE